MAKQELTETPIGVTTPLSDEDVRALRAGQSVLISGLLYTARDAAHKRMEEALERGEDLPFDLRGQVIYYIGPTPAPPGRIIGAAGPTTAARMDRYAPALLARGLKGMIGKGSRSDEVKEALRKHTAVYFGGLGGAGALLARRIQTVEIIAYEDLGTEAIRRLQVEGFPAVVVNDCYGGDAYAEARARWKKT
ncbi:MAG TPA: Fe-S-containing hydro-lyase [Armatimonadota bacterium]|nr:Fe-S-containing hydro-lyase [Armatimonadota bacterium]